MESAAVNYFDDVLDVLENLPACVQIHLSELRRLDSEYFQMARTLKLLCEELTSCKHENDHRKSLMDRTKLVLAKCQLNGDEKLEMLARVKDYVDSKIESLDDEAKIFHPTPAVPKPVGGPGRTPGRKPAIFVQQKAVIEEEVIPAKESISAPINSPNPSSSADSANEPKSKRPRRHRNNAKEGDSANNNNNNIVKDTPVNSHKKKKSVAGRKPKEGKGRGVAYDIPVDPDEPTYCLCEQVSYGEMIGCDNEICVIEWFHFNCVGLANKPKGKWFCPSCRGDKPNVLKNSLSSK